MPRRDDDGAGGSDTDEAIRVHRADRDPRGDGALLPRVLDVGHRVPGPARCAGRSEAGPPADPLLHVRPAAASRPPPRQVRQGGRRRHGLVPPPWRLGHLRGPGPHGPGLLPAPSAHRRTRQLRRHRTGRGTGGHALHRVPAGHARPRADERHRRGDGRLRGQLRRHRRRAVGPAGAVPEPAGQRITGHRRRHGHQHPAAQPRRGHRRHHPPARAPRGDPRRPDGVRQGPRLPDRGADPRAPGDSRRLRTGRGSIKMRAVAEIDEGRDGRTRIVVTEMPYQTSIAVDRPRRSTTWSAPATSTGSPRPRTTRRGGRPGWSSASSGTPTPTSSSTTCSSRRRCRPASASTWWPWSTGCPAPSTWPRC